MKKMIAVAVVALLGMSLLSPGAVAGKKKKKKRPPVVQTVEGTIRGSARHPDGCYGGIHRRLAIMTNESESIQGIVGWHFNVDKRTWGKRFKLDLLSGVGSVDLDITFYQKFGTQDDVITDPLGAGAPATVGYTTRQVGGEADVVPKGMAKVIVCIYQDENAQHFGANAAFKYVAGDGVK